MENILLMMKGINKSFSSVKVLDNVDFNIYKSSIMALLGENGAGKSTLVKILSGIYPKDSGEIIYNNEILDLKTPLQAYKKGIYIIMQELNLIPEFTVAEAMFMGIEPLKTLRRINWDIVYKKTSELLNTLKVSFSEKDIVKNLSVGNQKMVELARAMLFDANIIIMDEPTDVLTNVEKDILFNVIQNLKNMGKSLVYITHRLDEVFEICDRVTVLRDGKAVYEESITNVTKEILIKQMVGITKIREDFWENTAKGAEVLKVERIENSFIKDITFSLYEKEILGIFGLVGSGRTALAKTLYGNYKYFRGDIFLKNRHIKLKSCIHAKELGIVYVSEDRKDEGLIVDLTVKENITLSALRKYCRCGYVIDSKKESKSAINYVNKLRIKANSIDDKVVYLSGGNQQKVSIAKGLDCDPVILILDEPTRGVDVGARREIYNIINSLKLNGMSIIFISSDIDEISSICDRVMVMYKGQLTGILDRKNLNKQNLMNLAFNVKI
jgi:ribose transport system ATP-binding protein